MKANCMRLGAILASAACFGLIGPFVDAFAAEDILDKPAAHDFRRPEAIPDGFAYLKPGSIGNISEAYAIQPFVEYPPP